MARSRKKSFIDWLDESGRPIYLLDAERLIRYSNAACCAWLGVEADALIGSRCDYHTDLSKDHDAAPAVSTAGLCPPRDAFDGMTSRGRVFSNDEPDGRSAWFVPLSDAPAAVLVVVDDVCDQEHGSDVGVDYDSGRLHELLAAGRRRRLDRYQLDEFVGEVTTIKRIREQVALAGSRECSVVAAGQPGTGRVHLLRSIHALRYPMADVPMLPVDCSLLDFELLESILEDVAASETHAQDVPTGLLLLDVDQLSLRAQVALLDRLHADGDAYVTYATSSASLVQTKNTNAESVFSQDLANLLSTCVISVPPLSDRLDDMPLLIQAALERVNAKGEKQVQGIAPRALELLRRHPWRRNVEELFDCVSEAHSRAAGSQIQEDDLPEKIRLTLEAERYPTRTEAKIELESYLASVETELIRRALVVAGGNKAQAARLLGISRGRLLRRLESISDSI